MKVDLTSSVRTADIQNNVVLAEALLACLPEGNSKLREELTLFQKKAMSQLPAKAQQWLTTQITSPKTEVLGEVLKNHFGVYTGVHAEVYANMYKVLDLLPKIDMRNLDSAKYNALFRFIRKEIRADIAGKGSCLASSDGLLTFKLASHE